jgi:gliding motility-associated-like protein
LNQFGFTDSMIKSINYVKRVIYYVSNDFTPNSTGLNDVFKPILTAGFNTNDFAMQVFNRWGNLIYQTNNHENGWNGMTMLQVLSIFGGFVFLIHKLTKR